MGLGSSQEKQGNHQGLKVEVSEPQGNVQNVSAKGPEHSAHTPALTVISGQSTPLQCCPLPSWATNSAPAGWQGEQSSTNISRSATTPCTSRVRASPSTLPWLQDPPHQAHTAFTSGPVHPSGKRQNIHHLMLPKCPCLSLIPQNEKQSHLSKHTPPTAKITLKWPLRRLPSRTREAGWRSERTQDQALLASPAQQLAGSVHRSHGLSGAKPAPQPEATPAKEGMTLTPSSPKAPCNCVAVAVPSALPAFFLLAYLLSPAALIWQDWSNSACLSSAFLQRQTAPNTVLSTCFKNNLTVEIMIATHAFSGQD